MVEMPSDNIFVLIHSPLVGPLTWSLVADQMRQKGLNVSVPTLVDSLDSKEPFWKQHAESVSQTLANIPKDTIVILVAHSGAGPSLPVIRQSIANPLKAYVFVDAGIPRNGASHLDLIRLEDADWAKQFQEHLENGGSFPDWSFEDLQEVIPDEFMREQMVNGIHPRELAYFTGPIPVFEAWPDAPCVYIKFSPAYEHYATQARQAGWRTYELEAGHFHMLVDPEAVTALIIKAVSEQF
jgi:hypothetical protein